MEKNEIPTTGRSSQLVVKRRATTTYNDWTASPEAEILYIYLFAGEQLTSVDFWADDSEAEDELFLLQLYGTANSSACRAQRVEHSSVCERRVRERKASERNVKKVGCAPVSLAARMDSGQNIPAAATQKGTKPIQ